MAEFSDERFANLDDEVADAQPPLPNFINPFARADGSYARLFKKINNKPVLISKEIREFRLEELAYIRRIEVFAGQQEKVLKGLSIVAVSADGKESQLTPVTFSRTNSDGSTSSGVQYAAKQFCIRVRVRSTFPYRKLTINKVDVIGYTIDQLEMVANKLEKSVDTYNGIEKFVQEKKENVAQLEDQKSQIEGEIERLKAVCNELVTEKEQADQAFSTASSELKEQVDALNTVRSKLKVSQDALATNKNNDAQLKESIATINREIVQKGDELKKLAEDRNLISDEYRDYVAEGKTQSKQYLMLVCIPLAIIAFCSWQLYSGAHRILQEDVSNIEQLAALSLQRLPFAAALALVVTLCWKISAALIKRIMVIHGQRLTLAKLLVIAKDTVASSAVGADISEEAKFRERVRLKVEMLRGHLTTELGKDLNFQSETPISDELSERITVSETLI